MPELPEVETTRRGLEPHLRGRKIAALRVRERRLRLPIPGTLGARLTGSTVTGLRRRGKYLLLDTDRGTALLHLGMSGSLRIVDPDVPAQAHEHYDLLLNSNGAVRYRDPRRFGLLVWAGKQPDRHPLLAELGPEPFSPDFDGNYLFSASRGRNAPVKAFLMNSSVLAGVGNIYASESLFRAGVHPRRAAGRVGRERYEALVQAIRDVLAEAITAGGTTLRDFVAAEGSPGYYRIRLAVYDRAGRPCPTCGTPIRREIVSQRAAYYCSGCQH